MITTPTSTQFPHTRGFYVSESVNKPVHNSLMYMLWRRPLHKWGDQGTERLVRSIIWTIMITFSLLLRDTKVNDVSCLQIVPNKLNETAIWKYSPHWDACYNMGQAVGMPESNSLTVDMGRRSRSGESSLRNECLIWDLLPVHFHIHHLDVSLRLGTT